MRTLDQMFKTKMAAADFADLYHMECNVCANTVRIFECLTKDDRSVESLAADLGEASSAIRALRDADRCDPRLVVRLCRHLALPVPERCPKLSG